MFLPGFASQNSTFRITQETHALAQEQQARQIAKKEMEHYQKQQALATAQADAAAKIARNLKYKEEIFFKVNQIIQSGANSIDFAPLDELLKNAELKDEYFSSSNQPTKFMTAIAAESVEVVKVLLEANIYEPGWEQLLDEEENPLLFKLLQDHQSTAITAPRLK